MGRVDTLRNIEFTIYVVLYMFELKNVELYRDTLIGVSDICVIYLGTNFAINEKSYLNGTRKAAGFPLKYEETKNS